MREKHLLSTFITILFLWMVAASSGFAEDPFSDYPEVTKLEFPSTGSWNTMRSIDQVPLELVDGFNSFEFFNKDNPAPDFDKITIFRESDDYKPLYQSEAEKNVIVGNARIIQRSEMSGGEGVGYLGRGVENYLVYNVYVEEGSGGSYKMDIDYANGESISRTAYMVTNKPPICPRWAFEHWVWEDNENSQSKIEELVDLYDIHGIPVGAVIIDSPWEKGNVLTSKCGDEDFTQYNSFEWDTCKEGEVERYPYYEQMIEYLDDKNIKVLLWITGFVNEGSKYYDEVIKSGYCINRNINCDGEPCCELFGWWKPLDHTIEGVYINFTNPGALEWLHLKIDPLLDMGIAGWKVDRAADADYLGNTVYPSEGVELPTEHFKQFYYADFYDYSIQNDSKANTVARAYSYQGGFGAPISKSPISWQGDFGGDFGGLKLQMDNVYKSAEEGYGAPGVEVGGFHEVDPSKKSLIRYAQFGAMTPLMENGGGNGGLTKHLPWWWDEYESIPYKDGKSTTSIYKYYATLHSELVPYIFSYSVESHLTGTSILRGIEKDTNSENDYKSHHKFGEEIFVSLLTDETILKEQVCFPQGARWIDYWAEKKGERKVYYGGTCEWNYKVPLPKGESELKPFPIFIKVGAIIPMNVKNDETGHGDISSDEKITLNIYPGGHSSIAYHHPTGDGTDYDNIQIDVDEEIGTIKIDGDSSSEYIIRVKSFKEPTSVSATGADDGFTWDYKDQDDLIIIDAKGQNFTMTIDGLEGYSLITNRVVYDEENAPDWSIQKNLQSGELQYGDRDYQFLSIPPIIAGSERDWIRTANDSKGYTNDIMTTFEVAIYADVYIAHDDRITDKPLWLSDWEDTGEDLINNEPTTFSLYKKTFVSGSEISLGPNKEGGCTICSMYTIVAIPVAYGFEAEDSEIQGASIINKDCMSGGQGVGWLGNDEEVNNYLQFNNVRVSSAGTYTMTIDYVSGESREAALRVNGNIVDAAISFPNTGDWITCGSHEVTVGLSAGENTIRFFNENSSAPDFDRIVISPSSISCEGDFDTDNDVDGSDLSIFATDLGRTDCSGDCEGDFKIDGDVDGSDLAVFSADFGRTDCP